MTTAAASSPSNNRASDLLEELEQILKQLGTLSSAAKQAVGAVIQSLLQESDLSAAEVAHLTALGTRLSPREAQAGFALAPAHRGSERGMGRGIAIAISHHR